MPVEVGLELADGLSKRGVVTCPVFFGLDADLAFLKVDVRQACIISGEENRSVRALYVCVDHVGCHGIHILQNAIHLETQSELQEL